MGKTVAITINGQNRGLSLEVVRQMVENPYYTKIYALCRKITDDMNKVSIESNGKLIIYDGIDMMKDESEDKVQEIFQTNTDNPIPIDLLIHYAGAYGPPDSSIVTMRDLKNSQKLENMTREKMNWVFNLHTMAPFFFIKALLPNLKAAVARKDNDDNDDDSNDDNEDIDTQTKVAIVSSSMGSITSNKYGGSYAFRAAKAAVNMVGRTLATDLKEDKIAVGMIHQFGMAEGRDRLSGERDKIERGSGVIEAIDGINMENSGTFWHANTGNGVKTVTF